MPKPSVGGNVDAWCSRCNLVLAHTIEAMVGDTIKRVHCNTCNTQHAYKGHAPGEGPVKAPRPIRVAGAKSAPGPMSRASDYDNLMKGRDPSAMRKYSPKDKYVVGDLVGHPSFGLGVATALRDATKIEVLFKDGPRVLVHGR
jgi:hypothetical protein